MNPSRTFGVAAALARATTLLIFGLIVLGAVVRATGSGLACPDWPLCEGRIIPRFEPHVLIEWTHRTVALGVSLMLATVAAWNFAHRETRARLGGWTALALGLLVVQILLGALTVWKLLHPGVVNTHLAVALLLFLTLLLISERAQELADDAASAVAPAPRETRSPALLFGFAAAAALTYAQSVLGGAVSSQNAVAACPDWPTCRGEWFPAMSGLVGVHMAHRFGGYFVALVVAVVAIAARGEAFAIRAGGRLALTLVAAQVALGVCAVLLQAPAWIAAMHLATATGLLAVLAVTALRLAAAAPARARVPAPAPVVSR